jgi:hypothetical protein
MSDPSMPPPSGYEPTPLAYQVPVPPLRPTSVSVIAIIGIVLASLGLICTPFALIPFFMTSAAAQNPQIQMMHDSKPLMAWTIGSLAINFVLAILLLAASIGSLRLSAWARKGMIAWAIASSAMAIIGTAVQCVFVLPQLLAKMNSGNPADYGAAIGGIVGAVFGIIFSLILPAFILVYYRKPHVVDAFAQGTASRL